MTNTMRKFVCFIHGFDPVYFEAEKASKAKWKCFKAVREAGYRSVTLSDIRVRLAR